MTRLANASDDAFEPGRPSPSLGRRYDKADLAYYELLLGDPPQQQARRYVPLACYPIAILPIMPALQSDDIQPWES